MKPFSFPRIGLAVAICMVGCLTFLGANRAAAPASDRANHRHCPADPSGAGAARRSRSRTPTPTSRATQPPTRTAIICSRWFRSEPMNSRWSSRDSSKYVRKGITLEINQNARLGCRSAELAPTSQVVEVMGDVTQVDTVSATLGQGRDNPAHCRLAAGCARHDATGLAAGRHICPRSG